MGIMKKIIGWAMIVFLFLAVIIGAFVFIAIQRNMGYALLLMVFIGGWAAFAIHLLDE